MPEKRKKKIRKEALIETQPEDIFKEFFKGIPGEIPGRIPEKSWVKYLAGYREESLKEF